MANKDNDERQQRQDELSDQDLESVRGGVAVNSLPFRVESAIKASGENGGTADINIGVGELQECTISKSMDMASIKLAVY